MSNLKEFYTDQDKVEFYAIVFTIVCSMFIALDFTINYNKLPNRIPLFYSLPWGDSQLIAKPQFILLPSIILLIALINVITSWQLHNSQRSIKRLIALSTASVSLLILITAIHIIGIFI